MSACHKLTFFYVVMSVKMAWHNFCQYSMDVIKINQTKFIQNE